MRLTPEHLEELCANALVDVPEYIAVSEPPAYTVAYAVAKAMRTPITADALEQAGWAEGTGEFGGVEYTHALNDNERVVVWFANDAPVTAIISMERHFYPKGVTTMYALGQLVELLGGGA